MKIPKQSAISDLPPIQHTVLQISPGSFLFRQGDSVNGIYYLEAGRVQLYRCTEDGRDVVLHAALAGETIAEAALFANEYHCDAKALSDCTVWRFDKHALLNAISTDPGFAISYAKRLANQVRDLRSEKSLLFINDARQRVLMALHLGMLSGSIRQFAATIGLTEETVYRSLGALSEAGEIKRAGRGRYELISDKSR